MMGSMRPQRALFHGDAQAARRRKRAHYRRLLDRFGPLVGIARDYAVAETEMWFVFALVSEELAAAQAKRANCRGRRPSVQAVERLRKRQGVAFESWNTALGRLDELARQDRKPRSLADEIRARHNTGDA